MAEMAAAAWAFVKAAFVAVGSGTATAGQVATVVAVNVAGSVALSTAASVLMKPDVGGRAPGEWLADPNAGIPFAIGDRIGVAGNIVYKNTFGKDNEYKGIVTVLSGAGPISAYLGFTADREPIAFAGEAATGRYGGEMWMQRRLGEQPDTALTSPAAITYQALPNWGPNHRLSGKAAFMWTLRMDSKFSVYPQGEPAPITVLRGIKGYDHRYDSTMPGGSGPCRLNDRTTYRTITNPAIADLNWCLGLRENGKVVGGLGVSPAGIDWSAYTRAANVADANAWTLAAYPRSDESKSEVRAGMLQAAGAVISRRAGLVSCVTRGAPKSPVMTISAADTAGPIELDTAANVLNRYNTMTPRYLSEAHEWQLAPSAPVSSSVYVEEDRGRVRSDQRDYPYVPNAKQAAELCALDIAHSREGIAGRWPLKAYCRELEPGDVFTVNEPGLLLDGMDMLVLDRDYDPETDTPYVVFVSETPGKVAWALGQQANPSPTPALSARHDLNAPDPGAFDVVIVPPSPEGVSAPGAEVVIDIDNVRAEDLVIEIGPSFDGPWRVAKTVTINDGQLRIPVNELSPGEVFWVALSYRSADDGASPKTIKGPYTAGDLVAGDTTHLKGEPVQDVLDRLTDTATLADENRQAVAALEEVYGDTASAATSAAAAAASEAAAAQAKADALIAKAGAESSAGAAQTARTQAETARAGAETAQTSAANSATTATGAASTATTQAGIATTAKNDAQAASNAAVTAKNQASSFADAAGVSAAASQASSVTASTARDEALAALAQQGRLNLVQKSRVSAAPVAFPDTASGWGYRLVGGTTGTRISYVGPLKTNTPYSISFKARRVSGTTSTMNVDLFPDTLPERVFTVTSDQWTEYKWEGLTSAHADMTSENVQLRFFRASLPSGHTFEVADIKLEEGATATAWTPNPKDIELSASAAATSASNAAASETAAGASASAASTAKTQAETARGQAQTAATQASSSRDDAAGSAASASSSATNAANSRDAAAGSASAAAGSASTAATKAGEAGTYASAALASQVTASTARDEALQALMQQGRTNLVARENVAPGSPVTSPSPSTSGWGFTLTGNGGGVERGIVVGPLKQSTPYSVSFKARRSIGTGASALNVDLYPDTLPERVFQIDENWTDFKWEGLTSSHPDMTLPNVHLRFFRNPLPAGVSFEVTDVKLEEGATATAWTPSPKDAPASAQAAATSAASASASETAAGASATSASGSATNAATAAGQAQTYSNQASSSATAAAGSATTASQASGTSVSARDAAIGARNDAQAAAATAVSQSSSASASAAAASLSADLAASVSNSSGFNILKNSTFANGLTNWNTSVWASSSLNSPAGPHAFTSSNGTNNLASDPFSISPNFQYTLSADFRAQGASGYVVVDVQWLNSSGGHVAYSNRIFARAVDNVNFNQPRKSVTFTPPAGATQARVRVFTENITGLSTNGAAVRQIKLEAGDKPTAWRDDTQLIDINSQLNITAATVADLDTRMASARFSVTGGAGGDPFELMLRAGPDGSVAMLSATAIILRNILGESAVEALKLVNGEAYFGAPVSVGISGRRLTIGPGFGVSNGLVLWFGPNTIALSAMSRTNGYFAMGTDGKVYYGNAELGGGGGDSALRSTIGGSAGAATQGATWVNAGTATFSNLPAGGTIKIFASGNAQGGMTVEGSGLGTTVNGEARVLRGATVLATGQLIASVAGGDASASILIPTTPINAGATGAVTLTMQIRSTTANKDIGGTGMTTQIYAEWTKNG